MDYGIVVSAASVVLAFVVGGIGATAYMHSKFATKTEVRDELTYIRQRLDRFIDRFTEKG